MMAFHRYQVCFLIFAILSSCLANIQDEVVGSNYLLAWGSNSQGQLLQGTTSSRSFPVIISSSQLGGKNVTQITSGTSHVTALFSDGSVMSWGSNVDGALGVGTLPSSSLTPVALNTDRFPELATNVVQIASSSKSSLALVSSGRIYSWGSGALANGSATTQSAIPVSWGGGSSYGSTVANWIGCGLEFCCARTAAGKLYCTGNNEYGQLGFSGAFNTLNIPVLTNDTGVFSGYTVTQVSMGGRHVVALRSDGALVSWGCSIRGQLGTGVVNNLANPYPTLVNLTIPVGDSVRSIASGDSHTVVLTENGDLYGWGDSIFYQLGYLSQLLVPSPITLSQTYFWGTIRDISARGDNTYLWSPSKNRFYSMGSATNRLLGSTITQNSGAAIVNVTAIPDQYFISDISITSPSSINGFVICTYYPPGSEPPVDVETPSDGEPPIPLLGNQPNIPTSPNAPFSVNVPSGSASTFTLLESLLVTLALIAFLL